MQKKQKLSSAKFGFFNISVPTQPYEETDLDKLNDKYIPFGDDNLFPQQLAELKRLSSTHRAILSQKTTFTSQGFITDDLRLEEFIASVNADDESLEEIKSKVVDDFYTFGNAYIEMVHFEGGINLYHVDATTVRIHKDCDKVILHPDWTDYNNRIKESVVLPLYPHPPKENRCIVHLKDYETTFMHYGLPDYIAGLEHCSIDFEIGKWNNTKFKNNFQPSAIIEINADMGDAEAEELVNLAQDKFTNQGGAENNGKILFIVKNGDSTPANVTMIKDDQDASFPELQKLTDQNLITAHRWQPSLMGIISGGKLNSTGSEIRISYEIVLATVIKSVSSRFDKLFKKVYKATFNVAECNLESKFEPPISYLSDLDIKQVLTINEQRAILGFEQVEGGDGFMQDKGTTVNEDIDDNTQDNGEEKEEKILEEE